MYYLLLKSGVLMCLSSTIMVSTNTSMSTGNTTNESIITGNTTNESITTGNTTNENMTTGNTTNENMTNGSTTNDNMTNGSKPNASTVATTVFNSTPSTSSSDTTSTMTSSQATSSTKSTTTLNSEPQTSTASSRATSTMTSATTLTSELHTSTDSLNSTSGLDTTNTLVSENTSPSEDAFNRTAAIIGGSVGGGVLLIAIILGIVICVCRMKKKRHSSDLLTLSDQHYFRESGGYINVLCATESEYVNISNKEQTYLNYSPAKPSFSSFEQIRNKSHSTDDVHCDPDDKTYQNLDAPRWRENHQSVIDVEPNEALPDIVLHPSMTYKAPNGATSRDASAKTTLAEDQCDLINNDLYIPSEDHYAIVPDIESTSSPDDYATANADDKNDFGINDDVYAVVNKLPKYPIRKIPVDSVDEDGKTSITQDDLYAVVDKSHQQGKTGFMNTSKTEDEGVVKKTTPRKPQPPPKPQTALKPKPPPKPKFVLKPHVLAMPSVGNEILADKEMDKKQIGQGQDDEHIRATALSSPEKGPNIADDVTTPEDEYNSLNVMKRNPIAREPDPLYSHISLKLLTDDDSFS